MWLWLILACGNEKEVPDTDEEAVCAWEAPDNRWPLAAPPEGLCGEGFDIGEIAPDVRLTDQFGDEVSLWQFYGTPVMLEANTMWTYSYDRVIDDISDEYGVMVVSLLSQDAMTQVPSAEDVDDWIETYDIETPVLIDDMGHSEAVIAPNQYYNTARLLGADMRVLTPAINIDDERTLREALDAL